MTEVRLLQLSAEPPGASAPALELQVGTFQAPTTLGARADVVIAGADAVQARVYFDGSTLFVSSTSPEHPVLVNETPLGTQWAPVFCPALLKLGEAQLDYVAAHAEVRPTRRKLTPDPWGGHTLLMGAKAPFPQPSAGFESVTVIAPLVATPGDFEALGPSELNRDQSSLPPEPITEVRPSAWSRLTQRVREDFRRTPRNIRVTLFALPIIGWGALSFGEPAEPTHAPAAKTAAARATVPARAMPSAPAPASAVAPQSPSTTLTPPPAPASPLMRGKRSLEAGAADAAARGAYRDSARQYLELAQANPGRPEFASAARILQTKQSKQGPP